MKMIDYELAQAIYAAWKSPASPAAGRCPILRDLDQFLAYVDAHIERPGISIFVCPGCQQEHRWSFIRELLIKAVSVEPRRNSRMLEWADRSLDEVREMLGGEESRLKYEEKAAAFFASVGGGDCYKL